MPVIKNTIVVPIIRPDFILQMLTSLHKYTDPDTFRVIVIDQSKTTEAQEKAEKLAHLWIRPYRNLGFSKAMNIGIVLSQTPYVTLANDDIEFMNSQWWQGILDTFAMDPNILAVNPSSPKEGAFGYGLTNQNKDTWQPKEGTGLVRDPDDPEAVLPDFKDITPSKAYFQTEEGYNKLLNEHPHWLKGTVNDAIAMWCTVFKREGLQEIGLLEERFYPGSGEDYDMNCRAYSCGWPTDHEKCDTSFHRRMVGTTKSWVWHHWGKSKELYKTQDKRPTLFSSRPHWNNNDELWLGGFDVWGHIDGPDNAKVPLNRAVGILIDDL